MHRAEPSTPPDSRLKDLLTAGEWLLTLKDGPRDQAYAEQKELAWAALRAAVRNPADPSVGEGHQLTPEQANVLLRCADWVDDEDVPTDKDPYRLLREAVAVLRALAGPQDG